MVEAIRLVIWDLDDTFWRGTVTEGGISEYVQAHHDIVIELCRRGIMSSICSKNDVATITPILKERGVAEYFIFPSISWEPKGIRISNLVEAVQLRPSTVMFIDDNPGNRAEAVAITPELQVEDETFISRILEDPRFRGKDDSGLTRLKQYKLLEQRKQDENTKPGNNEEFLRSCSIHIYIEYDIEPHLDRVIELINRTNQLNFTKHRLSNDLETAREQLRAEIKGHNRQAGLVRVIDKYGDYGFTGFFLTTNDIASLKSGLRLRLRHYCFSCRTLGMFVELWLYNHLNRPALQVKGDVLTDLNDRREIDWITRVSSLDDQKSVVEKIGPEIHIVGGCEANAIGVYLRSYTENLQVTSNFAANSVFVHVNSVPAILSAATRSKNDAFAAETEALGLPFNGLANDLFADTPEGCLFIINGSLDAARGYPRYYHRDHGWELVMEPHATWNVDLSADSDDYIESKVSKAVQPQMMLHLRQLAGHMRRYYRRSSREKESSLEIDLQTLIARVPVGSKLIFLIDDNRVRSSAGEIHHNAGIDEFRRLIEGAAVGQNYVGRVLLSDSIENEGEILVGGNHYERMVYWRAANEILAVAQSLQPKSAEETILLATFS